MIVLAADHGGFHLKEEVKKHLEAKGVEFVDVGTFSADSIDYPDIAKKGCEKITSGECDKGLFFCGTGVGISIAANKVKASVLAAAVTISAQNTHVFTTTPTFFVWAVVLLAQALHANLLTCSSKQNSKAAVTQHA